MSFCLGAGKPLVTFDLVQIEKFMAQQLDAAGITTTAQLTAALAAIDPETVAGRARINAFVKALASCCTLGPTPT
jgi:hypothetical protein